MVMARQDRNALSSSQVTAEVRICDLRILVGATIPRVLQSGPVLNLQRSPWTKGVELQDKFMASAPFHTGNPRVIAIKAIHNDVLSRCHDEYRDYLTTKHMEEPAVQELYHGTNNN